MTTKTCIDHRDHQAGSAADIGPASPVRAITADVKAELQRRTARLVHELRNPLNGILGAASLMRYTDDRTVRPDPERLLRIIETSGRHMLRLVGEMTDVVLSPQGPLPVHPRRVDLRRLMRDSLDILEPLAASRGLLARLEVDNAIPDEVIVDPTRLQQVVVNLLGNALRFTDSGVVEVTVRSCSPSTSEPDPLRCTLRFDVRDTGVGMAHEELIELLRCLHSEADRIPSRNVRRGGSGFGLLVCQGILETMKSELNIVSSPGGGTRVWFVVQA